jgi:hypothetical protein
MDLNAARCAAIRRLCSPVQPGHPSAGKAPQPTSGRARNWPHGLPIPYRGADIAEGMGC